jgi:N utilization substance protein A
MPANYELLDAFGQIMREKSVDKAILIETLEAGLVSAARRKFGPACEVEVKFDEESGTLKMALLKNVVEQVSDEACEIGLEDAKAVSKKAEIGSTVAIPLSVAEFGRNAIQAAKQVLIQRVREAEREKVYEIFHGKIGTLVTGTVQQVDRGNVILKLERSEAILPNKELMRRDRYRQGDHVRAVVVSVDKSAKGPQVMLSRTRPEFVQRLFEGEVPEIAEGIVDIKGIAREAGARSKVSVSSNDDKVDAVGACVGIKGTRVQSIVRELGGERIDVISWSSDATILVSRSLSPAKVSRVISDEKEGKLTVVVSDDQLSLAIGKGGQNARLAAKLVGWKIDLVSQEEMEARDLIDQATRIDIEKMQGVGPKLGEKLVKAGVETVEDLHKMSMEDLLEVPGVGKITAERLKETAKITYEEVRKAAEEARAEAERVALEEEQKALEEERKALEEEKKLLEEEEEAEGEEENKAALEVAAGVEEAADDAAAESDDGTAGPSDAAARSDDKAEGEELQSAAAGETGEDARLDRDASEEREATGPSGPGVESDEATAVEEEEDSAAVTDDAAGEERRTGTAGASESASGEPGEAEDKAGASEETGDPEAAESQGKTEDMEEADKK